MPPRRRPAADSLTAENLSALAVAVAEGRRATVYLREGTPSLGLAPGASARVISVDGTTVVVRPRGVDDELPYEAEELRMTKNAPEPPPTKPRRAAKTAAAPATAPAPAPEPKAPASPATPTSPKRAPAAKRAAARASSVKSVTVTIYGSPENEWSVLVTRGARKPQRSRTLAPEAVDAAVRELGDETAAGAVTALLHAAREEAQRRVEELSRELEAARQALAALDQPQP